MALGKYNPIGNDLMLCFFIISVLVCVVVATDLDNIHKTNLEKLKLSQQIKTSSFCLYPGYLTKENGRIYWTETSPVRQNDKWIKTNSVDVTNCIFDPFPYSQGDENTTIKINSVSEAKESG